ncbi:MAG: hypothetical protein EXQ55_02625 [Acidobacteria bacterium]|nr:hypothetical protein [Acidobacteriota bacterium]
MRKTSRSHRTTTDLRPEYEFDYRQARPNRFASRMSGDVVAVVLEPDVAKVFDTSESVNRALRSILAAIPSASRKSKRKAS